MEASDSLLGDRTFRESALPPQPLHRVCVDDGPPTLSRASPEPWFQNSPTSDHLTRYPGAPLSQQAPDQAQHPLHTCPFFLASVGEQPSFCLVPGVWTSVRTPSPDGSLPAAPSVCLWLLLTSGPCLLPGPPHILMALQAGLRPLPQHQLQPGPQSILKTPTVTTLPHPEDHPWLPCPGPSQFGSRWWPSSERTALMCCPLCLTSLLAWPPGPVSPGELSTGFGTAPSCLPRLPVPPSSSPATHSLKDLPWARESPHLWASGGAAWSWSL